MTRPAQLHVTTPLVHSPALSQRTGQNVYLKLDSSQPSGSFKLRGIGHMSARAFDEYGSAAHLVSSSGGNAGLAVAYSATQLDIKSTIFVPTTTEASVVKKLQSWGAEVRVGGRWWNEADLEARTFVKTLEGGVYIHPFEGEELVRGHSSLIDEIIEQMPQGQTMDAIICAVGGAGLLAGILHGLTTRSANGKEGEGKRTKVITTQCFETDSFTRSFLASPSAEEAQLVVLDKIGSKATSMATVRCSSSHLGDALRYGNLTPIRVEDDLAASAVWQFHRDHDTMVELSCGAALAPLYYADLLDRAMQGEKGRNVVVVVCGGSKVDEDMIRDYRERVGTMDGRDKRADVDGVSV